MENPLRDCKADRDEIHEHDRKNSRPNDEAGVGADRPGGRVRSAHARQLQGGEDDRQQRNEESMVHSPLFSRRVDISTRRLPTVVPRIQPNRDGRPHDEVERVHFDRGLVVPVNIDVRHAVLEVGDLEDNCEDDRQRKEIADRQDFDEALFSAVGLSTLDCDMIVCSDLLLCVDC